jgi:hypothetical protein
MYAVHVTVQMIRLRIACGCGLHDRRLAYKLIGKRP